MVRIFITMADSGDFTDLFAYINKRNTAIHGSPSNEYKQYLNVYCFVHSSIKRKDAVSAGQAAWKASKAKESSRAELYRSAIVEMEKIKAKPTIVNLFASSAVSRQPVVLCSSPSSILDHL